jgi:HD superfamily phosphohydrolase
MYWQVYLHKTVIAADRLLLEILSRARVLMHAQVQVQVFASPALAYFLSASPALPDFASGEALRLFALLDDSDIDCAVKVWMQHEDKMLSELSKMLVHRRLPKIELRDRPFETSDLEKAGPMAWRGEISNEGYESGSEKIKIRMHNGTLRDIYEVSDMLNSQAFLKVTKKYYLCYPKN